MFWLFRITNIYFNIVDLNSCVQDFLVDFFSETLIDFRLPSMDLLDSEEEEEEQEQQQVKTKFSINKNYAER